MKEQIGRMIPEAVKRAYWRAWLRFDIWTGERKHRRLIRAQRRARRIEERFIGAEPGGWEYRTLHNARARRHHARADAAIVREELSSARARR